MRQAGEPSVEEILESIKKVIARDNRTGAAEERREREERGLAEVPQAAAPSEDVLDLAGMGEYVEADEAADDAAHFAQSQPADAALVGTDTVSSISESLAALALMAQPPAAPQIVRSGETSLEGMVRDLLRPELAAWLD